MHIFAASRVLMSAGTLRSSYARVLHVFLAVGAVMVPACRRAAIHSRAEPHALHCGGRGTEWALRRPSLPHRSKCLVRLRGGGVGGRRAPPARGGVDAAGHERGSAGFQRESETAGSEEGDSERLPEALGASTESEGEAASSRTDDGERMHDEEHTLSRLEELSERLRRFRAGGGGNQTLVEERTALLERLHEGRLELADWEALREAGADNSEDVHTDDSECVDEDGMPLNPHYLAQDKASLSNRSMDDHCSTQNASAVPERGCRHYSRGCLLIAPCCGKRYWCRHCHNEEQDQPAKGKQAHALDRFAVRQVVCVRCNKTQPVQQACDNCGNVFGAYFCSVCKFFDDDLSKGQFHCEGCGICRIGGRENFFHCDSCGCCYALGLRGNHKCIAGAMRHNCPVCLEDLFHSTSQVRVLRCGHTLHRKCLAQLLSRATALHVCPLCSKTVVDHSMQWQQMDLALAQTPMPEDLLNKTVAVLCNDCQTKGTAPYHVLGLKCPNAECGGYNTRQVPLRQPGICLIQSLLTDTACSQIMDADANYTVLYMGGATNYSSAVAGIDGPVSPGREQVTPHDGGDSIAQDGGDALGYEGGESDSNQACFRSSAGRAP